MALSEQEVRRLAFINNYMRQLESERHYLEKRVIAELGEGTTELPYEEPIKVVVFGTYVTVEYEGAQQ